MWPATTPEVRAETARENSPSRALPRHLRAGDAPEDTGPARHAWEAKARRQASPWEPFSHKSNCRVMWSARVTWRRPPRGGTARVVGANIANKVQDRMSLDRTTWMSNAVRAAPQRALTPRGTCNTVRTRARNTSDTEGRTGTSASADGVPAGRAGTRPQSRRCCASWHNATTEQQSRQAYFLYATKKAGSGHWPCTRCESFTCLKKYWVGFDPV